MTKMATCRSKQLACTFWRGLKELNQQMARPNKLGLAYFALDTDFLEDFRIRKVIRRRGGEAVLVYLAILGSIYKSAGYYLEIDEDTTFILAEQTALEEEFIMAAIKTCVEVGLFDEEIYFNNHVLTSRSIQLRYVEMLPRYRVIPEGFMRKYRIIDRSEFPFKKNEGNPDKNEGNSSKTKETPIKTEETPNKSKGNPTNKIKVNKIKLKESKEKEIKRKESFLPVADAPAERDYPEKEEFDEEADFATEEETETGDATHMGVEKQEAVLRCNYRQVVELYHETCKSFPKIRSLTEQRKQKVKQRLAEMDYNLDTLAEVFRKMEASEFMRSGGWASFDWIFANSGNWIKVLEGNYDNERRKNESTDTGNHAVSGRVETAATSWEDYNTPF